MMWGDTEFLLEWISGGVELFAKCQPVVQAYGICFDSKGQVVVVSDNEGKSWTLPGGTLEKEETPVQTLEREVMEEADLKISDIEMLGLQRVSGGREESYQARFVAKITEALPQTIDPAKGKVLLRRFIDISELNALLKWGTIGDELVRIADLRRRGEMTNPCRRRQKDCLSWFGSGWRGSLCAWWD